MSRKITALAAILFVFAVFFETSTEGAMSEIRLRRTGPEEKAIGTATVRREQYVACDSELVIILHRLEPGVYSVWLKDSRTGERAPAGFEGENHFKADASGNASYSLYTSETNLNRRELEIAFHTDGDPGNTAGMVVVLHARLYM